MRPGDTEESRPEPVEEMGDLPGGSALYRRRSSSGAPGPSGGQLTAQDAGHVTDCPPRASERD